MARVQRLRRAAGVVLLGSALDERYLRFGPKRSYRGLARLAQSGEERIDLVERANRYRSRTWV
jgi:serine/threonine-protein kinase PknG